MITRLILTITILLTVAGFDADAASRQTLRDAKAYLSQAYVVDEPGGAIIVVEKGDVVLREGYGLANMELNVPITPESVFRIGSITKQLTATAIMMLQEQGKLSVSDSISEYLPDYPTHGHEITIEHLLTHTSGIMSYTNIPGYMGSPEIKRDVSTDELIEVFKDKPMEFAPGAAWNYNNSGYVLLGAIIEKLSGESYADFIKAHITEPLGLKNTHYEDASLVPNRASGYMEATKDNFVNAPYLSMTQPHAAGSIISTVDDLATWNEALVSGKLISNESYEQMTHGFLLADGELFPYGFGLGLGQLRAQPVVAHSGGIHGFSAYGLWYPQEKVYVAVLTNSNGYMPSPTTVGKTVAAIIIGDPYPERKATNLSDSQMSRFVGSYAGEDAPPVEISIVEGGLEMDFGGFATYTLNAESIDTFFIEDSLTYMDVEWTGDAVAKLSMYFSEGEPPTELTPIAE